MPFEKNYYEQQAWTNNKKVCGLDEVGRGCLAGPLVVAAVVMPIHSQHSLLKDSKKLSVIQREAAFAWINQHCYWTTSMADHIAIDSTNIQQLTISLMKRAYLQLMHKIPLLQQQLRYILVDALPFKLEHSLQYEGQDCHYFNYGESLSTSIAAASIVAKVTRDRIIQNIDAYFPSFNLGKHKGYGTAQHIARIKEHGPSLIHRLRFLHDKKFSIQQDFN